MRTCPNNLWARHLESCPETGLWRLDIFWAVERVPRQLRRNECEGSGTVRAQQRRATTAGKERRADDKERRLSCVPMARPGTIFRKSVVRER